MAMFGAAEPKNRQQVLDCYVRGSKKSMKRLACVLMVSACTGGDRAQTGACPSAEACSPETPGGIYFVGAAFADESSGFFGPAPTVVGGTQSITLEYDRDGWGIHSPLDLPFSAEVDGAAVAIDHVVGPVVTVRGTSKGSDYLRILDPADHTLYDRKQLDSGEIDRVELVTVSDHDHLPDGMPVAWAAGVHTVAVALFGQAPDILSDALVTRRLVDTSMQLSLVGGKQIRWDALQLTNTGVGNYELTAFVGASAKTVPFSVVDHADDIIAYDLPSVIPSQGAAEACFAARNQGRFVIGLPWSYDIDGTKVTGSNCMVIETKKNTGTVTINVSAGGQATTVVIPVGPMLAGKSAAKQVSRSPLGERAELAH